MIGNPTNFRHSLSANNFINTHWLHSEALRDQMASKGGYDLPEKDKQLF